MIFHARHAILKKRSRAIHAAAYHFDGNFCDGTEIYMANITIIIIGNGRSSTGLEGVIFYILGLFGMGIMLTNIPSYMLLPGIVGALIYILPILAVILGAIMRPFSKKDDDPGIFDKDDQPVLALFSSLLYSGGSMIKNILKYFIAPYASVFFNVFLALFWICYPIGSVSETALIGIVVSSAYSMYYFPYVLFKAAKHYHSKLLGFATAGIIVASLALFLINYDRFMAIDSVVGLAFFFTMLTVLGTLTILITNLVVSKRRGRHAVILALFLALVIAVGAVSAFALPNQNEERYEEAMACLQNGEYRRARELFLELGRYQDSEEQYNAIKYVGLEVGEKIVMGSQVNKPDSSAGDNPLSWTVIAVEDGKALLLSDAILTSIDSNSLASWNKSNSVRNKLGDLWYLFNDVEKEKILDHSYSFKVDGEEIQATDKLFLLSREELINYCAPEQIFSKKDTKYNDHQVLDYMMQDSDYEYVYSYYVRNTDDTGEWMIADCQSEQFVIKSNKYVGIRPAMYISIEQTSDPAN